MKVTIAMRGTLKKKYGTEERCVELNDGATCNEALLTIGVDYKEDKGFGFVSVNGLRVDIEEKLNDGDYLKAFSKVYGG